MKEQYIRQVWKALSVPRRRRREIIRDLNEAFDSALEHGETERQVIERFGAPADFAAGVEEQIGVDRKVRLKRRRLLQTIFTLAAAALPLAVCIAAENMKMPDNVIGQADAMTSMQVEGAFMIDAQTIAAVLSGGLLAAGLIQMIGLFRTRRGALK